MSFERGGAGAVLPVKALHDVLIGEVAQKDKRGQGRTSPGSAVVLLDTGASLCSFRAARRTNQNASKTKDFFSFEPVF